MSPCSPDVTEPRARSSSHIWRRIDATRARTGPRPGTSITVSVEVYAERYSTQGQYVKVTEATLTYVAIDAAGRPRPIPQPAGAPGSA